MVALDVDMANTEDSQPNTSNNRRRGPYRRSRKLKGENTLAEEENKGDSPAGKLPKYESPKGTVFLKQKGFCSDHRGPDNSGRSPKKPGANASEGSATTNSSTAPKSAPFSRQQNVPATKRSQNQQQEGSGSTPRAGNGTFFKPHISEEEVQKGLESGVLLKGQFRINQRNYEEAFINNPEGTEFPDIAILGMQDRNRALHGDMVAVSVKPRFSWVVNEDAYKSWKKEFGNSRKTQLPSVPGVTSAAADPAFSSGDAAKGMVSQDCRLGHSGEDVELREDARAIRKQVAEVLESIIGTIDFELRRELGNETEGDVSLMDGVERISIKQSKKKPYRLLSDLPLEEWNLPDDCLQKTGEVVRILEEKNTRLAMGKLEASFGTQKKWAKFSPSDSRMPRLMIDSSQLPKDFFDRPQDFASFLFLAKLVDWPQNSVMARGSLEKQLGPAGDIAAETEGLLATNGVDTREFSEEVIACLPTVPEGGWRIEEDEIAKRRDLRDEITFTIDPKTARDLDDALSISPCEDVDGNGTPGWEVGVHIADVSYFVYENTELDQWAAQRATSVYLVHEVVPMLPRLLCEELCSLNGGVDRLTFSVVWKMDEKANIFDEWFGRSVIRSRVKLTYEHAQDFIENPEKDFEDAEMPEISDGTTVSQIKEKVLQLHGIARLLRQKRADSGSLQLDQPKMKFALDDENKAPIGVTIFQAKDSNRLVEEFMLLANMAVARKIERHYRKTALLRCHPPPKAKVLRDALKQCNTIGFPIDGTSSQQLSSALAPFRNDSQLLRSINQVLSMVLMKAMELARYFCTGSVKSQTQYHHYALNVPFYTHFTSPIRRYPDIIVHRLLAACLGYCEPSERTTEELEKIAQHCNDKKLIAKKVSESSAETFFGLLVQRIGPIEAKGVVVNVLDAAFDVMLFKYGVIKRVYVKCLEMRQMPQFDENTSRLTLYWSTDNGPVEQQIQMCTIVDVVLSGLPEPTKYQAVIKPKPTKDSPTLVQLWRELDNASAAVIGLDL